MKKNLTLQVLLFFSISILSAQNVITLNNDADISPFDQNLTGKTNPQTQAIWDVLYNYDLTAIGSKNGNAGVCVFNNEFWVSRWGGANGDDDTLMRIDASGNLIEKFRIAGVTGTRSLTTNGTLIYAGNITSSISIIDPATKTTTGTITAPIAEVRSLTYDSTANSGAGGFWASTWATDITQFDMSGASLNTISSASHGLTSMYGTAFDKYSYGGPFLWVFHQAGQGGNKATIVQINIASQIQTGVWHDVTTDVGAAGGGGLAGGIFLRAQPGLISLVGILQAFTGQTTPVNRLFAYDLDAYSGASISENSNPNDFVGVYPNPVKDRVNIYLNKQNNDEITLQIFDVTGKTVFDKKTRGLNNYINLSRFESGIYVVKATYNGQEFRSKLVKE